MTTEKEGPVDVDYQMEQGVLLDAVVDVQMKQGICFALATEWCLSIARDRNFDPNADFFRMVSRQRAYNLTFEEKIKKFTKAQDYALFFHAAETPSQVFMDTQAGHEGLPMQRQAVQPQDIANQLPGVIAAGRACLLGFFGVDNDTNWGHATAVGWRNGALEKPRFFDPNQGQFSWPAVTATNVIAQEIIANVHNLYGAANIRDYVLYTV
jgi:hypothetical protein